MYVDLSSATLRVDRGQIISNSAHFGGGVYVSQGSAILGGTAVVSNTATSAGGGIYNSDLGTLTLINSTVSRNAAATSGGGLYSGGTSALTYTTVTSNTAASGGGGIQRNPAGTVLLQNTIVAYADTENCNLTLTSNGHNLDSGTTCGLSATGDITGTDPLLGPLADDGGTLVHPLLDGSPAINAGACLPGVTTIDQRGVTRPRAAECDIGAYEYIWRETYLPLALRNN